MVIMFGMGTSMSFKDFAGVIKMPKGVFIGVVSHFIIMPLIGFTLASLSNFPPEIAAGIVLVGCSKWYGIECYFLPGKSESRFVSDDHCRIYNACTVGNTVAYEITCRRFCGDRCH